MTRGINVYEYFTAYKFYEKKANCRKLYYTNYEAHKCESAANGGTITDFKDKAKFNAIFKDFIHRGWMLVSNVTENEFKDFISKHESCIYKPVDSSMGRGVFKLTREEALEKYKELYAELYDKNYLCEECVIATDELRDFNIDSLNTIRMVTVNLNGDISIPWSFFRIGRKNSVVDNGHNGGLVCMVNPHNGIIYTPGITVSGGIYYSHPDSQKQIIGVQIPRWHDIVDFSYNLARHYPQAVISGWDIALSKDGTIELIEGNSKPDLDIVQHAEREGMKKVLDIIAKK